PEPRPNAHLSQKRLHESVGPLCTRPTLKVHATAADTHNSTKNRRPRLRWSRPCPGTPCPVPRGGPQVTTPGRGQGALRRACPCCSGDGWMTLGWPDNVSWDDSPWICSCCAGRGWVEDDRTVHRHSGRRMGPRQSPDGSP